MGRTCGGGCWRRLKRVGVEGSYAVACAHFTRSVRAVTPSFVALAVFATVTCDGLLGGTPSPGDIVRRSSAIKEEAFAWSSSSVLQSRELRTSTALTIAVMAGILTAACSTGVSGDANPASAHPAASMTPSTSSANPFDGVDPCTTLDQTLNGEGFPPQSRPSRMRSTAAVRRTSYPATRQQSMWPCHYKQDNATTRTRTIQPRSGPARCTADGRLGFGHRKCVQAGGEVRRQGRAPASEWLSRAGQGRQIRPTRFRVAEGRVAAGQVVNVLAEQPRAPEPLTGPIVTSTVRPRSRCLVAGHAWESILSDARFERRDSAISRSAAATDGPRPEPEAGRPPGSRSNERGIRQP
jgi:hypothetical protein